MECPLLPGTGHGPLTRAALDAIRHADRRRAFHPGNDKSRLADRLPSFIAIIG
jgi:hypothetical protein